MKRLRIFISVAMILGVIVGAHSVSSAATTANNITPQNQQDCEVYTQSYSIGKDTITANFVVMQVRGTQPCNKTVTLASWNAPNGVDGAPFEAQTLEDYTTGTFNPGFFHSLTVRKPKCFYQADLLRGASPYGATYGLPDYTAEQYVSSAHGGEACEPPKPVKPVKPVKKVVKVVKTQKVEALPNTGPGAVLSIAGLTGVGAGVAHYVVTRKRQ